MMGPRLGGEPASGSVRWGGEPAAGYADGRAREPLASESVGSGGRAREPLDSESVG
jgi:hypothetical protein